MSNLSTGFSDKTRYGLNRRKDLKRWVKVGSKQTSISLEQEFWEALKEIASRRSQTRSELVSEISMARDNKQNLSSAIRIFVLPHYWATRAQGYT
jgi:predicted DNA-binding ribbon-helix-helix protein